jgi:hypothetical protein
VRMCVYGIYRSHREYPLTQPLVKPHGLPSFSFQREIGVNFAEADFENGLACTFRQ